ncbi:PAS domain S-box protein [Methanoregula sp.]|uniref:PAS domain S-box protein n=1 Tax=Methanoregula sp. TaxID=2052170 RepID=UPI00356622FA
MALSREITAQIKEMLEKNPQGLSITDIVRFTRINRNTAGRYLDSLLVSGQVEMRPFGMAKIYTLSERLPLSSVLSISSECIMQLDGSLRVIYMNTAFEQLLGVAGKDILGRNIEYSVIPQVLDTAFPRVLSRLREGVSGAGYRGELDIPALGRIFLCRVVPIVNTEGQKGVSVLLEDITSRKEDEERLRRSENQYRMLAEASRDLIFLIGRNDRIEYVNSIAAAFVAKRADELIGRPRGELFPEAVTRRQQEALERVFKTGMILRSEGPLFQDNTLRWFDHCLVPLTDKDGVVHSVLGISRDITERKKAEEEIFSSRQMLQLVLDTVPGRVFWKDKNSVFLGGNKSLALDVGYKDPSELIGKTDYDNASASTADLYRADDRAVMETGIPKLNFEEPQIRPDGSQAWLLTSKVPLRNKAGEVIGVLGIYEDITERKKAESELLVRERQYRFIVNNSLDIITRQTPTCICTYVSPSVTPILGYSEEESLGMSLLALVHPEDISRVQEELHAIISSKNDNFTATFRFRRKDGSYLWFESVINVIRDKKSGQIQEFLSISRDITDRIQSEENARKRDRVLRALGAASGFLLTGRIRDPFPRVLSTMGEAMGADAAYIYRDVRDPVSGTRSAEQKFRWTKDPARDPGADVDCRIAFPPPWSERLASGTWIAGPRSRFNPPEQEVMREMGIQSILIVPIQVHGVYWGFIGCSNLHGEHDWADAEIEILMTLAATIGLVLERKSPDALP